MCSCRATKTRLHRLENLRNSQLTRISLSEHVYAFTFVVVILGCPQDPKKEKKKEMGHPDRSTSCWRVEILRV